MESENKWNKFKSHFQASNCDLCKMVTTAIHGDYNSTVKNVYDTTIIAET